MVADALVYHPTISHYLKYVATTGTYLTPQELSSRIYARQSDAFGIRCNQLTMLPISRSRQIHANDPILLPVLLMVSPAHERDCC